MASSTEENPVLAKYFEGRFDLEIYYTHIYEVCKFCAKRSPEKDHIEKEHRDSSGKFKCSLCLEKFIVENSLINHVLVLHGERFKCPVCEHKFSMHKELINHLFSLHPGDIFRCIECGQKDFHPARMRFHVLNHIINVVMSSTDTPIKPPYKCLDRNCGDNFGSRREFQSHFQNHFGRQAVRCAQCTFSCDKNITMTIHVKRCHQSDCNPTILKNN